MIVVSNETDLREVSTKIIWLNVDYSEMNESQRLFGSQRSDGNHVDTRLSLAALRFAPPKKATEHEQT